MCVLKADWNAAWYSHSSQECLTPSCLDCLCVFKADWNPAWYSHLSQEYFTPSCLDCLCVLKDFPVYTGYIIYHTFMFRFSMSFKTSLCWWLMVTFILDSFMFVLFVFSNSWLIHCLILPDTHILYKNTWLLHVYTVCVF